MIGVAVWEETWYTALSLVSRNGQLECCDYSNILSAQPTCKGQFQRKTGNVISNFNQIKQILTVSDETFF